MGVDTGSAADHVVVSTGVTATGHREALASRRGEQRGRRLLDHFALRPPSGPPHRLRHRCPGWGSVNVRVSEAEWTTLGTAASELGGAAAVVVTDAHPA